MALVANGSAVAMWVPSLKCIHPGGIFSRIQILLCIYTCIYVHVYVYVFLYICICVYICTCICNTDFLDSIEEGIMAESKETP